MSGLTRLDLKQWIFPFDDNKGRRMFFEIFHGFQMIRKRVWHVVRRLGEVCLRVVMVVFVLLQEVAFVPELLLGPIFVDFGGWRPLVVQCHTVHGLSYSPWSFYQLLV